MYHRKQVPVFWLHPPLPLSRRKQCRKPSGWVHPPASVQCHGKEAATCTCHTSVGRGRINRCGPALPAMLPLHPALLPPSLSSQGKGKGRKGRSQRPTAVATATYKKLFIPCLTHTHVTAIRYPPPWTKHGTMVSPGTVGVSSCLQLMDSDSPMSRELRRKSVLRSWRQVKEIKEHLRIVIAKMHSNRI